MLTPCRLQNTFGWILLVLGRMQVGSHIHSIAPSAIVETDRPDRLIVGLYEAAVSFVLGLALYLYLILLLKMMLHLVVFYLFAMFSGAVDDDACVLLPMQFWFRPGSSRWLLQERRLASSF